MLIGLAQRGNEDAQLRLAYMYKKGQGTAQDYTKAFEWYSKAAESDIYTAQYNLGLIYEKGLGVNQDMAKAKEWQDKAAANDIPF